jgi:hypothetical protein
MWIPIAKHRARVAAGLLLVTSTFVVVDLAACGISATGAAEDANEGGAPALDASGSTVDASAVYDAGGSDAAADADAGPRGVPPGGHRVFVSLGTLGTQYNFPAGDLCAREAADAGLPGVYVPWLSSNQAGDAIDRLLEWQWYLVDGTPVANSKDELTGDAGLRAAISVSARGVDLSSSAQPFVWTGTQPNGRRFQDNPDCSDWDGYTGQGATGRLDRHDAYWTAVPRVQWLACNGTARIYCFQN